jgi:hypothetical protein
MSAEILATPKVKSIIPLLCPEKITPTGAENLVFLGAVYAAVSKAIL